MNEYQSHLFVVCKRRTRTRTRRRKRTRPTEKMNQRGSKMNNQNQIELAGCGQTVPINYPTKAHFRPPEDSINPPCCLKAKLSTIAAILLLSTIIVAQNSSGQQQVPQQDKRPQHWNQSSAAATTETETHSGASSISSPEPDGARLHRRLAQEEEEEDASSRGTGRAGSGHAGLPPRPAALTWGFTGNFGPLPPPPAQLFQSNRPQQQQQQGAGTPGQHHWLAPRFALEPPPLVEYSNSTGTVLGCRAQLIGGSALQGQQQQAILDLSPPSLAAAAAASSNTKHQSTSGGGDQRRLANAAPVSISWRLVRRLPGEPRSSSSSSSSSSQNDDGRDDGPEVGSEMDEEEELGPLAKGSSNLRTIRQDGALVLSPFKASEFRQDVHLATYRCCLANRFGQLCSRPVRTRAVIDSAPNLEVFDEFVLAGNSVILSCQAPSHLESGHLDHVAWLKDDKIIVTRQQQQQQQQQHLQQFEPQQADTVDRWAGQGGNPKRQWPVQSDLTPRYNQKYLMLQTGELLIRSANKVDAGSYKCRARHRLTGAIIVSKIGGQLMVDDTSSKSSLRPTGQQPLIWTRENSQDIFICAQFQSLPVATYSWFWQPAAAAPVATNNVAATNYGERRPIGQLGNEMPDIKLLQPHATCLVIQQAHQRHSGFYTCEANVDGSTQTSTTRLVVSSAQLAVQLLVQPATFTPPSSASATSQQQQQLRQISMPPVQQLYNNLQQIVQLGASLQLNCSISGHPYQMVSWFKDSKLIAAAASTTTTTTNNNNIKSFNNYTSGNNIKLVQQTVIRIDNFGLKDRGVYQCQVYTGTHRIPSVSEFAIPQSVVAGASAANNNGGAPYPPPSKTGGGHLEELMKRDYLRSASASVQLDLAFSRPTLSGQRFQSQTVPRGAPISLQCAATGLPNARILWFLDNQPIISARSSSSSSSADGLGEMVTPLQQHDIEFWGDASSAAAYTIEPPDHQQQQQTRGGSQPTSGQGSLLAPGSGDNSATAGNGGDNTASEDMMTHEHYEPISDERFHITTTSIVQQQQHHNNQLPGSGQMPLIVSQLNVSQAGASETGHYKCIAINALGFVQHEAQISVLGGGPELRVYQPNNVTLMAGQTARLQCPLIGFPLARVDWFRNDQRLPTSHRQRIEPIKGGLGGQLELTNVDRLADAGLYSCRATLAPTTSGAAEMPTQTNAAAVPLQDADDFGGQLNVMVKVAPLIDAQSLPEVVKANEGMRTKLVCSVVQGDHPVEIRWLRRARDRNKVAVVGRWQFPGLELMENSALVVRPDNDGSAGEESVTIHNLEDSCLLTFKQISYADSMDYLCLAQNDYSRSMRWTRVIVNVAPSWSIEPVSDLNVMLGARLRLECLAHGFPGPTVTWKRQLAAPDSSQLDEQTKLESAESSQQQQQTIQTADFSDVVSNFRQRFHPDGSLIIDQIEQNDGGNYMCEVTNGIGTGLSKVLRVKVNVPPYFRQRNGQQMMSQLGGRIELRCVAYGDQPMLIGWLKDGGDLVDHLSGGDSDNSRHRLQVSEHKLGWQSYESILTIQALVRNDSGQYVCVASNEFGTEESRVQLFVQEPPEAPVLMRPIRAGSRQATLSFKAPYPGNSPIRKYAILFKQMSSVHQGGLGLMSMAGGGDPATGDHQWAALVTNFTATTSGNSNKDNNNNNNFTSQIGWQQVLVDGPSAINNQQQQQQQQPHLMDLSSTSATSSPSSWNAMVRGPMNESSGDLLQNHYSSLVNLNLCCLQPYSKYMVRVRALNDIGQSESSKMVQLMTDEEAIGGPPLDVGVETTGAHSLKVRWRAPSKNLQNGLVRGYYIGYRAINGGGGGGNNANTAGQLELLQHQQQQQRAAAAGNQLLGPQTSEPSSSSGTSGSNVKILDTTADGEQYQYKNVQLDFSVPNFQQQQLVDLSNVSAANLAQQQQQPSLLTQTMAQPPPQVYTSYLTNLRRKTAYSIIVQAYNKIGAGPRSDQIIVTTLDAAPPMSPILKLVSVSYNSALLTWSGRRFSPGRHQHQQDNSSSTSGSSSLHGRMLFSIANGEPPTQQVATSLDQVDENLEEDDDPHSYYTLNFRTDDPLRGLHGTAAAPNSDEDWQQRRLPKRQPLPYVLNNLKCGSHHTAFMTATNSLGQSEPGESVRFATMGAAPIAPQNSRDFLQVNSTYVMLRLGAWQGAGCTIGSFLLKYRASNQMKWIIVEHQVHPTVQTVTISGSAVFSTRPLGPPSDSGSTLLDHNNNNNNKANQQQQQLGNGDFVIRNLLIGVTYRLVVEANSEAGATIAEYELDTANYSTSTISISVNGISASESQQDSRGGLQTTSRTNSPFDNDMIMAHNHHHPGGSNGELDFGYSGGQQRASSFAQRYTFGVWSLTALFVIASVLMAGTALVLGLRSVMRTKTLAGGGSGGNGNGGSAGRAGDGPLTSGSVLCCLSSSGASSSSSGAGTDSNSSSGGGTCYQVSEHPLEAYCSQLPPPAAAASGLQMLACSEGTPKGQRGHHHARLGSISNSDMMMMDNGGELKSLMGLADSSLPFRHQLVSSSSLSTIGGIRQLAAGSGATRNTMNGEDLGQQQQISSGHTHTLGRDFLHQQQRRNGDPNGTLIGGGMQHFRAAQYAATLGKQHSSFLQQQQAFNSNNNNLQPIKYNTGNNSNGFIYGRLQQAGKLEQQQHYVLGGQRQQQQTMDDNGTYQVFHQQHHHSSNGTTSGYETGTNSARLNSQATDDLGECQSQIPVYLQQPLPTTTAIDSSSSSYNQQMNLYGQSEMFETAGSNLFHSANGNNHRSTASYEQQARSMDQGGQSFHYNVPTISGSKNHCQQISNDYGMLFGVPAQTNQLGQQPEMKGQTRPDNNNNQFDQESMTLHHLLSAPANDQNQQ